MLASSTPKLSAVYPPTDSMEFVIADYNVCMTVTCHVPQAGSDFGRSCAPGARVDAAFVTEKA
ncbi:hypothetical protein EXN24_03635 [Rhizobium rhizogenes]|uniref:Uncharacterized protein n=2 Tax=Rhizobium/Agrobacterium group TaxID=227290 RepID=A0AB36EQ68_AGRTU|nr:hypothetical protein A6U91_02625 [Agrobacterium tumefaciens]TRA90636.1 hypothetical protein EXN24_03635 [Rhizobium rhizogenes]HCV70585.1 hypothetical protein [Agrobacterium sp.]